jgi:NIMA (never in mitosis gene a)-related kinase
MDKYTKIRRLGKGSFGEAWLVECKRDATLPNGASLKRGQQLVTKLVDVKGAPADQVERAIAEAKLLESIISHRVILHVEHFLSGGDTFVIVMEYAPGGSVGDKMKPGSGRPYPLHPLSEDVAMSIASQVRGAARVVSTD